MRISLPLILAALLAVSQARRCYDMETPYQCNYQQQYCDLGYDEYGCWMGAYCEETIGSMRCPVQCECMYGEIRCDDLVGDLECPSFYCIPDPAATSGNQEPWACPAYCPAQCDTMYEEVCPGQRLSKAGCLDMETCVPYGQCQFDWDGCPIVEYPECANDQYPCEFDYDSTGCRVPGTAVCVGNDEECPLPTYDCYGCAILPEINCPDDQMRCEDMVGASFDVFV